MTSMIVSADPNKPVAVRGRVVETLRRDLIGPGPLDADIEREELAENPSRWYLTGFIAPVPGGSGEAEQAAVVEDEGDPLFGDDEGADPETGRVRAADDTPADEASSRPRRLPSSLGLTVLVPDGIKEIEARVTWGDYAIEPPLPPEVLENEGTQFDSRYRELRWRRVPGEARVKFAIPDGRGAGILLPGTGGAQRPSGGLKLEIHARPNVIKQPDGSEQRVNILTVMVVNQRSSVSRRFADVTYAFQVRLELCCPEGFYGRHDLSGYGSTDPDAALSDLHYREVAEYAVGRGCSAGWPECVDGVVRSAFTEHLPKAEVERVEPNERIEGVEFGMEVLASLAAGSGDELAEKLAALPKAYVHWINEQHGGINKIKGAARKITAEQLVNAAHIAAKRIADGIELLRTNGPARRAFVAMNEAVSRAARRRNAGPNGDPISQPPPKWRPFQLAFILLNLRGLAEPTHDDREIADLLFFPTGGGKTEAYLGLAAWMIAHRRLTNGDLLGAGVTVLMRYTLRLLTLDQLSRAAGVICALELMRGEAGWQEDGKRLLGDWPIEIGLWVGSAASPNRLGKKGDGQKETALARIRGFRKNGKEAPAPIKACPWCGSEFTRDSFKCTPNEIQPKNMVIGCANLACDFTKDRPLPVLTVDEAIYRRLPAFLIATVDKFASLPWVGESGAFFGHVDRYDEWGFFGASEPGPGKRLWNGHKLLPPDLIIQDELHLISGPLGTVAALYEVALDRLATREWMGKRIRPKVVASTATVRRASAQVQALFDRKKTAIFPPPGPDRRDSFFAMTASPEQKPARLYLGLASPGRGPKLIFLRALTTLLAAARAEADHGAQADAYETAVCYFNALRELGGARRIVEDEVRARLASYGANRRRIAPPDSPFADRRLRMPLELTSRVSTDQVADAKDKLALPCVNIAGVDVALATNMISVGLDIGRLGLMVVQGQPKAAAEYIQATSRVGRREEQPGLVLVLLNAHKPRDRMHYEQFRNFHTCFYRSVEATSVTPWAARALDRALAAVIVAIGRHLDPGLSPDDTVAQLSLNTPLQEEIIRIILERAPEKAIVGGHTALRAAISQLIAAWISTADEATATGNRFYYGFPRDKALLHDPLDPILEQMSPESRMFKAGRSMRDVEHATPVRVVDPWRNELG